MSDISSESAMSAVEIANNYLGDAKAPQFLKKLAEEFQRLIDIFNSYGDIFYCEKCRACLFDHGVILVFKDSRIPKQKLTGYDKTIVERGILKEEKNEYVFTRDYIIHCSSSAAALAKGSSTSQGTTAWKTKSGKTLKDLAEKRNIPLRR